MIGDRQREIEEENAEFNPLVIFPEMTTSNGTHLCKFKRGAFTSLRTIQPCYVKISHSMIDAQYNVLDILHQIVLLWSSFCCFTTTVHILPEFTPNDHMMRTQRHRGESEWEIYAECVRDAIAKHGNFEKEERPIREFLQYAHFMMGRTDELTLDGTTYNYHKLKESAIQVGNSRSHSQEETDNDFVRHIQPEERSKEGEESKD